MLNKEHKDLLMQWLGAAPEPLLKDKDVALTFILAYFRRLFHGEGRVAAFECALNLQLQRKPEINGVGKPLPRPWQSYVDILREAE